MAPLVNSFGMSLPYNPGSFLNPVISNDDTAIIAMHYQHWTSTFTSTAARTYESMPGSELTFNTTVDDSQFILMADFHSYQSGTSGGVNMAYYWQGTMYAGWNGSPGDSWMGGAHSGVASGGMNNKKILWLNPGLSAGTEVTTSCAVGHWSGTSSSVNSVYPGYSPEAEFIVLEFKNPS